MRTIFEYLNWYFGLDETTYGTLICKIKKDLGEDFDSDFKDAIYSYHLYQLESEDK